MRGKLGGVALARHADHQAEAAARAGLDAGNGVLDDHRACRVDAQRARRLEKHVRRRLAGKAALDDAVAVHGDVEQRREACRLEHAGAVLARGHYRRLDAGRAQLLEQRHRSREHPHALGRDHLVDQQVLALAQAVHRFRLRRIVRRALGQRNVARAQEVAHAVAARLAVDVPLVVGLDVERHEGFTATRGTRAQEFIEHAFPGAGVHARGVGQHAVHVEQDGVEAPARNDLTARIIHARLMLPQRPAKLGRGRHADHSRRRSTG